MNKFILTLCLLLLSIPGFSNVTLTDEEYDRVVERLKKDRTILDMNTKRWEALKTTKPKIFYETVDDKVIIQKIEIPIYNEKPLIYEVKFSIDKKVDEAKFFPLQPMLCGMIELHSVADFKFGLQLLSLAPLQNELLKNFGFNALIGVKSSGFSISYRLGKPFSNTFIHAYTGMTYTLQTTYGLGIALSF